ncbi:MAG: hypothetical protein J6J12_02180 [Oscillospiraceae bacterium]|nr:hypothetical protein [Oscillospiraceae bacterium]
MSHKRPKDESLLRITALRIIKDRPGIYGMPQISYSADFYCVPLTEPKYFYETEDEVVVYIEHRLLADACLITASFDANENWSPTAILCEGKRLTWHREGQTIRFTFEISGLTGKTRTLYVHTLIRQPGLTVRIEQNAEGRRAGQYRKEAYPATQIEAASHYVFAARKVLEMLKIPEYLSREELGYILLLSFETCNEVHGDWPPHWHFIFRWPDHCGSPAPHIYMDENGRNTHNMMYIDQVPDVSYDYQPGQWCPFMDKYGRLLLRMRLDEDGGYSVERPQMGTYSVSAFDGNGVSIRQQNTLLGRLQVENDTRNGQMVIRWQSGIDMGQTEQIRYDPLTGETQEAVLL